MKTIRKGAHPLKHVFAAVVIVISLTMAGQARAADWSDEHFSCNLDVSKSSGDWYEVWLWGVWTDIKATFFQTGGEASMKMTYKCTIVSNGPKYICRATDNNYFFHVSRAEKETSVELNKGISKGDACGKIFRAVGIRWWEKSRR